jgi:pSer/pThr/pTyr-binding forkhead associated (FHA) protein
MEAVMVVEVLSGHHRVRARHRFAASGEAAQCTVGRSAACDVVLDDPYVAAVHARISVDTEGRVTVTDLESVNGIEVAGLRRRGGEPAELDGDGVFRVGHTRLRVRTAREVVAPERADRSESSWWSRGAERNALTAGFVVSIAVTAFQVWTTTTQPRELSTALVTTLLTLLGLAGLWIALWALASRVAFGESRWLRHATIVAVAYAGSTVTSLLLGVVNGALGLHLPPAVEPVLFGITVAAALSAHLVNASPMRARFALGLGATIPAVIIAAVMWTQARGQNRSPSYVADRDHVVPPVLVMRRGVSLERFATEVTDLRPRADDKRAFVEREDPSPDDEDETD